MNLNQEKAHRMRDYFINLGIHAQVACVDDKSLARALLYMLQISTRSSILSLSTDQSNHHDLHPYIFCIYQIYYTGTCMKLLNGLLERVTAVILSACTD